MLSMQLHQQNHINNIPCAKKTFRIQQIIMAYGYDIIIKLKLT